MPTPNKIMGRKNKKKTNSNNAPNQSREVHLSESATIDIFARLQKPFIISRNITGTVQYEFRQRRISVNGLCLVCMNIGETQHACKSCKMVSYCSMEHLIQDQTEHKSLCQMLASAGTRKKLESAQNLPANEFRVLRIELIASLEENLRRPLELWEKEIVLYPQICRTCFKFCEDCCQKCNIDSYCESEEHKSKHETWCSNFQIFKQILSLQKKFGSVRPEVPNFISDKPYELENNLDTVFAHVMRRSKYYRDMDCYTYAMMSHLSTTQLTTLYALQTSYSQDWRTKRRLVVHVIGAEFEFECCDLQYWESMFLHFLPSMNQLNLLFVGPELHAPQELLEVLERIDLCSKCTTRKRSINISFHPGKLYHEISNEKMVEKPDIICLFNPGLYRNTGFKANNTWPDTIKRFCDFGVPVVITSYTEYEIPRDISRIQSTNEVDVILKPQKNAFASLKPDRNFVSDEEAPLIYKNYYLSIVKGKKSC